MNWTATDVEKATKATGSPATRPAAMRPANTSPAPNEAASGAEIQEVVFNSIVLGNNGTAGLLRMHWTRRQRALTQYEYVVAAARLRPMPGPVRLELMRYSVGPPMDYDNLVSTGKLLVDALVRCGILPDDNPTVLAERHYSQERAAGRGEQRTVIRLIPIV